MRMGLKLGLMGFLLVMLMVPLALLDGLVGERQLRGQEVAAEIARSSSGPQRVVGPLLLVEAERVRGPRRVATPEGSPEAMGPVAPDTVRYLVSPLRLAIGNQLRIEQRGRSLFKVPLYHDALTLAGEFRHRPPATDPGERLRPRRAWLVLGLGDNRGVQSLKATLDGRPLATEAGSRVGWLPEGLHAAVPISVLDQAFRVELQVDLAGTSHLGWLPVGAETTVEARADWPHPGFDGRHLPLAWHLTEEGFQARWSVSRLSSRVPRLLAACGPDAGRCEGLEEGGFGVRLVDPVDRYLMTERAMKYALLFLGLVFGAVFLVEALAARPVHLVQYGLTGLALAMFYLLLLSLSEHIGFGPAYALAAAACSGLLGYYLAGVLGGGRAGLGFGLGLAALYGLLFTLLGSEDYALLVGAVVLFAALASVMALTRRVDWHRIGA